MSSGPMIQIGPPSLDRPFGIYLWPIFERIFSSIKGYEPQDFEFVPHQTPISTHKSVAFSLIAYYIIILGGRELMKDRQAFKLNTWFKLHNLTLTVISGALLALFLEQLIPIIARQGIFNAICKYEGGWTDKLVILYYVRLYFLF